MPDRRDVDRRTSMGATQSNASHLQGTHKLRPLSGFLLPVRSVEIDASLQIGSSAKPTIPSDISSEAENFLQLTFELNHEARPDALDLVEHVWITG